MKIPKALLAKYAADVKEAFVGSDRYAFLADSLRGPLYPLDLDFTLDDPANYYEPKDDEGIPMRHYRQVGTRYNPTRVAAYGLASFNRFQRRQDEAARSEFLRCADWFARSEAGLWTYDFDWDGLAAPWTSCMAQGEAMSVLTRAAEMTGESRYLAIAEAATRPFHVPIAEGGLASRIGQYYFLEEYPASEPAHTLNGFLYAFIGLIDLRDAVRDAATTELVTELAGSLEALIRRWDLGFWSSYDLHRTPAGRANPATAAYHNIHVTLLTYIGAKLQLPGVSAAAEAWKAYAHSPSGRLRALGAKIAYRREVPSNL